MIDFKELNKLLDKSYPGMAFYESRNNTLKNLLRGNARELLRLAEIGKRVEEFAGNKKDYDGYMSEMAGFFNKSGARL